MLPMPAGREASAGVAAALYERNRPERTLLYQLVEELYPAFKAHLAAQGSALPGYVEREFDESPRCGRLERGFFAGTLRHPPCRAPCGVQLQTTGLLPQLRCPAKGESAALLVDEVFTEQPVRQWVLSFPYPLRFLIASRPGIPGRFRRRIA